MNFRKQNMNTLTIKKDQTGIKNKHSVILMKLLLAIEKV